MRTLTLIFVLFALACFAADDSIPSLSDAKQRFEHGDFVGAEKVYSALAESQPDNLLVLSNLGVVRFRLGNLKTAEKAIRQALRVAPKDKLCHRTLAIILQRQGRDAEALAHFKQAGEAPPKPESTSTPVPELIPLASQQSSHPL